jgi:hypothetical protein
MLAYWEIISCQGAVYACEAHWPHVGNHDRVGTYKFLTMSSKSHVMRCPPCCLCLRTSHTYAAPGSVSIASYYCPAISRSATTNWALCIASATLCTAQDAIVQTVLRRYASCRLCVALTTHATHVCQHTNTPCAALPQIPNRLQTPGNHSAGSCCAATVLVIPAGQ